MKNAILLPIAMLASTTLAAPPTPPATEKKPVQDTYHGITLTDDYRWLEDWNSPAVKAWSEAQNTFARSKLDTLPNVEAIRKRVTEILSAQSESFGDIDIAGGTIFAMKRQPPKQQPFIVVLAGGVDKPEAARVLLDPNVLDSSGHTAIDWYAPSHDGRLVAVSISRGGSESGDVHVYDATTGSEVGEAIPRVNGGTAGGSLAWNKDSSGFFYTRYPRDGERSAADMDFFTQVYFHKIGTPSKDDVYELGAENPKAYLKIKADPAAKWSNGRKTQFEFTRIAEIGLQSDENSNRVLCTVQHGDGGTFAIYLRDEKEIWRHIADYDDKVVQAAFGQGSTIYLISRADAPKGKILTLDMSKPEALVDGAKAAKILIPEGKASIVSEFPGTNTLVATPNFLIVNYQLGGPSELRLFDFSGVALPGPTPLPISEVGGTTITTDHKVLFSNASYVQPAAWYEFDPVSSKTRKTALALKAPVNFDDCEILREFATSKDGAKIPVNIMYKKGVKLDGSNPCLVTGYGGYGVNMQPAFRAANRVLMDHGFVWAQANIRGGGEYGEEWHHNGALTKKQNVFDDFAAACKYMIDTKYTTSSKLAIEGGSNGGLLMGALLTQHPELVKAVVSHVGIYDMLRVELSSNGAFNIPEFGTVTDKAQFDALYAYHRFLSLSLKILLS